MIPLERLRIFTLGATAFNTPPRMNNHIMMRRAPLLPREAAHWPPNTEPKGPPTQNAATAILH
jgi:hypothetical protein